MEPKHRLDLLRAMRNVHRVRAFGEDLLDPVPLVIGAARLMVREIKRPVRAIRSWAAPRTQAAE